MIIDRFEGEKAIIELGEGEFISVNKELLPSSCREGDVIIFENNEYKVDKEQTKELREQILKLQNDLFK